MDRFALAALLALAAVSSSCARAPARTMVPSPILMQDKRLDFSRPVLPERRTTEVSVLFATTRAPAPPDASERFTRRAGDQVHMGVARVQLGKPEWSFDDLVESDRVEPPGYTAPGPRRGGRGVRRARRAGRRGRTGVRRRYRPPGPDLAQRLRGVLRARLPRDLRRGDAADGQLGSLSRGPLADDRLLLANGHAGAGLSLGLPACACLRARHRADDRARRRAQPGTAAQRYGVQLRRAAAR